MSDADFARLLLKLEDAISPLDFLPAAPADINENATVYFAHSAEAEQTWQSHDRPTKNWESEASGAAEMHRQKIADAAYTLHRRHLRMGWALTEWGDAVETGRALGVAVFEQFQLSKVSSDPTQSRVYLEDAVHGLRHLEDVLNAAEDQLLSRINEASADGS